jgi:HK97 family phage major capsid protein
MAQAIDLAVWYGGVSSSLNDPTGILNNTTITRTALGTTALGAVPSYANLIGMQTTVGSANGWGSGMAYLTNHSIRGLLKVTPSSTSVLGAGFIVQTINGQDYLDGYPLHLTNAIPSTIPLPSTTLGAVGAGIIFGYFADENLIVALWSGMDILVDPFSQSSTGKIRIVGFQDCDTNVRQAGAFVRITDAKAATT